MVELWVEVRHWPRPQGGSGSDGFGVGVGLDLRALTS